MVEEAGPNFWQFLIIAWMGLWTYCTTHFTRILGVIQGTLAVLSGSGVIPVGDLKYYIVATAVLTFWRGQGNADTIANKVIAKQTADALTHDDTDIKQENPK